MEFERDKACGRTNRAPLALGFAVVGLSLWLAGCGPMGARTIPVARFDYNDAITTSFDSQMLLNLVRLRYQDSILFLDVSSVVASYSREMTGGLSPSVGLKPTTYTLGVSGEAKWSETPTISYAPLQGEDFAKRLLAPIQPTAILLLLRSGWGLERLLLCAVQQLNEVPNGLFIGGVAPAHMHHFEKFSRVAVLLRSLQEAGHIQFTTLTSSDGAVVLTAGPVPMSPEAHVQAREVAALLNVAPSDGAIPLESPSFPRAPTTIALSGRSFLGVMTFLAQHVEVPNEHVKAGVVALTRSEGGKAFDWDKISRGLFRVHSSRREPARAYIKVQHRDYWFWIDDADVEAKRTYTLLSQLFSLQAASDKIQMPVLTIPTR